MSEHKPKRIVVADDNEDSVDMLAELFKLLGHEVWTANDGIEALARASEVKPDVVVLDLGMPRMDGYEAARRIRESSAGKDTLLEGAHRLGAGDRPTAHTRGRLRQAPGKAGRSDGIVGAAGEPAGRGSRLSVLQPTTFGAGSGVGAGSGSGVGPSSGSDGSGVGAGEGGVAMANDGSRFSMPLSDAISAPTVRREVAGEAVFSAAPERALQLTEQRAAR